MENLKEIGKLLQKARTEKGMSVEHVSKKTHIHHRIIENLEKGVWDNKMGKVYLKSFLKKYSEYLGIDPEGVVKGPALQKQPEKEQKLYIPTKAKSDLNMTEYIQTLVLGGLLIFVVIAVLLGVVKITSAIIKSISKPRTAQVTKKAAPAPVKAVKKETQKPVVAEKPKEPEKTAAVQKEEPKQEEPKTLDLTLHATDNVWVSVQKDGSVIFKGIIKKGATESWSADKQIDIRAGKLEALEFSFNGRSLGKIGSGVENIVINKKGIKVGNKSIRLK